MWYLIVPPIIVVVSLSFVLWYLSRKGADPLVVAQVSKLEEEAKERVAFLRTRRFLLRLLEKTAYRFKVMSLRLHNTFHNLTQSLKASERRFQMKMPPSESTAKVVVPLSLQRTKSPRNFFRQDKQEEKLTNEQSEIAFQAGPEESVASDTRTWKGHALDEPIIRNRKETLRSLPLERVRTFPENSSAEFVQPQVVNARVTQTKERARQRMPQNSLREKDFIARIALNPKDFAAYEGLGDYYLAEGNIKDAKECYRQVLKLSPVQRMVKIKIRRLEKLLAEKGN